VLGSNKILHSFIRFNRLTCCNKFPLIFLYNFDKNFRKKRVKKRVDDLAKTVLLITVAGFVYVAWAGTAGY